MKKYTALFAALTLVLALAGCGAETQTPMPGQSEQEEFTQNSTENVNETDGMTLLDSVFDTLTHGAPKLVSDEQMLTVMTILSAADFNHSPSVVKF